MAQAVTILHSGPFRISRRDFGSFGLIQTSGHIDPTHRAATMDLQWSTGSRDPSPMPKSAGWETMCTFVVWPAAKSTASGCTCRCRSCRSTMWFWPYWRGRKRRYWAARHRAIHRKLDQSLRVTVLDYEFRTAKTGRIGTHITIFGYGEEVTVAAPDAAQAREATAADYRSLN